MQKPPGTSYEKRPGGIFMLFFKQFKPVGDIFADLKVIGG